MAGAQIIENAAPESRGVKRSVQIGSPHGAVGRDCPIKALGGLPAFADDPESRLRGRRALRLPHVNLVANNLLLVIKGQRAHLLGGFFRLKGGGAFEETQAFH